MTAKEKIAQKRLTLLQLAEMCRTIYIHCEPSKSAKEAKSPPGFSLFLLR
jgi:hypothetical protein